MIAPGRTNVFGFRRAKSRKKLWDLADRRGWDVDGRGDELRVRWTVDGLTFETSNFLPSVTVLFPELDESLDWELLTPTNPGDRGQPVQLDTGDPGFDRYFGTRRGTPAVARNLRSAPRAVHYLGEWLQRHRRLHLTVSGRRVVFQFRSVTAKPTFLPVEELERTLPAIADFARVMHGALHGRDLSPSAAVVGAPAETAPPTGAPEAMTTVCDGCGSSLAMPEDLTRTTAVCSHCGRQTALPPHLVQQRLAHHRHLGELTAKQARDRNATATVRSTLKFVLLIVLVPVLVIGGGITVAVVYTVSKVSEQAERMSQSPSGGVTFGGTTPAPSIPIALPTGTGRSMSCDGDATRELVLDGERYTASTGAAVVAAGRCQLRLVGASAEGQPGVEVRDDARVVLAGGTFTGTGGGPAVVVSGRGRLRLEDGATLEGDRALVLRQDARAELVEGKVVGSPTAISVEGNAHLDRGGASIEGEVIEGGAE